MTLRNVHCPRTIALALPVEQIQSLPIPIRIYINFYLLVIIIYHLPHSVVCKCFCKTAGIKNPL